MASPVTLKDLQDPRDRLDAGNRQIRMLDCPACGAGNRASRAICFNCGGWLRADLARPWEPAPAAAERKPTSIGCAVCGATNRAAREACFNCGSLLRAQGAGQQELPHAHPMES